MAFIVRCVVGYIGYKTCEEGGGLYAAAVPAFATVQVFTTNLGINEDQL